jgi:opacity protein-like surface antigen
VARKEHDMRKLLFGAFVIMLAAARPALAQDKVVFGNIGGSVTIPVGEVADRFGTGGGFNIGVTFSPTPVFGFQVEYSYNKLAGDETTIPLYPTPVGGVAGGALIESHHDMHYIDFNAIVQGGHNAKVRPYGLGGFGMYYRNVSLTTPDVGYTTWCDPYWYVCYPTLVEIDRIIGDRNSWDPGINIGGGVSFALGDSGSFYVETRWHYMWGPEFTDLNGNTQKANGQYFPITFGFRF